MIPDWLNYSRPVGGGLINESVTGALNKAHILRVIPLFTALPLACLLSLSPSVVLLSLRGLAQVRYGKSRCRQKQTEWQEKHRAYGEERREGEGRRKEDERKVTDGRGSAHQQCLWLGINANSNISVRTFVSVCSLFNGRLCDRFQETSKWIFRELESRTSHKSVTVLFPNFKDQMLFSKSSPNCPEKFNSGVGTLDALCFFFLSFFCFMLLAGKNSCELSLSVLVHTLVKLDLCGHFPFFFFFLSFDNIKWKSFPKKKIL